MISVLVNIPDQMMRDVAERVKSEAGPTAKGCAALDSIVSQLTTAGTFPALLSPSSDMHMELALYLLELILEISTTITKDGD